MRTSLLFLIGLTSAFLVFQIGCQSRDSVSTNPPLSNGINVIAQNFGMANFDAPNKKLIARNIANSATRLNGYGESVLAIIDVTGNTKAELDLTSSDQQHGYAVINASWTPDSEFFVVSTTSSGGHSPWNFPIFFYSVRMNCFGSLEDYIGPVNVSNFKVNPPDRLFTGVMGHDFSETVQIDIRLSSLVQAGQKKKKGMKTWMKTSPLGECDF